MNSGRRNLSGRRTVFKSRAPKMDFEKRRITVNVPFKPKAKPYSFNQSGTGNNNLGTNKRRDFPIKYNGPRYPSFLNHQQQKRTSAPYSSGLRPSPNLTTRNFRNKATEPPMNQKPRFVPVLDLGQSPNPSTQQISRGRPIIGKVNTVSKRDDFLFTPKVLPRDRKLKIIHNEFRLPEINSNVIAHIFG